MSVSVSVSSLVRELDVSVVERDIANYLARHPTLKINPARISLASLPTPKTRLAEDALAYSHSQLDPIMFNHSCRMYYIGMAMAESLHNPPTSSYLVDSEAYYLTSMLHDLGITPSNMANSRLSFEYHGGMIAHRFIVEHSQHESKTPQQSGPTSVSTSATSTATVHAAIEASGVSAGKCESVVVSANPLADEVAEAIIRHTGFVKGYLTTTGQLIQLASLLEVLGAQASLIHEDTLRDIEAKWPRMGFTKHFAHLLEEEMKLKPWSHATSVEEEQGFCAKVRANLFAGR